jgi:S1-C subfamily serine protease
VDGAGLVKVATFVKEAVVYMGSREEPLTVTIASAQGERPTASRGPSTGRRVRIGTIPDFAFQGPGVRVDSVARGSPAEKAGLQAGDILLRIDDSETTDLRTYSNILETLEAGQVVTVTVRRGDKEVVVEVRVETR